MNSTWWIAIGIVAAGLAVLLLLPTFLPDRESVAEGVEAETIVAETQPEPALEIPVEEPDEAVVEEETAPAASGVAAETEAESPVESEPATQTSTPAVVPGTAYATDGVIGANEYAHTAQIAGVDVYWSNDASFLQVGLVAPGVGYVSIGFDPDRRMEGANYIIGYVEEGKGYIRDDYGNGTTSHIADTDRGGRDDITAFAGAEWPDQTILEFTIPLDSGDAMDKPLVPGSTYTVLLAYHDLQDGFALRHSRRGLGEIQLDPAP